MPTRTTGQASQFNGVPADEQLRHAPQDLQAGKDWEIVEQEALVQFDVYDSFEYLE